MMRRLPRMGCGAIGLGAAAGSAEQQRKTVI